MVPRDIRCRQRMSRACMNNAHREFGPGTGPGRVLGGRGGGLPCAHDLISFVRIARALMTSAAERRERAVLQIGTLIWELNQPDDPPRIDVLFGQRRPPTSSR
jgi:hypothetical protein